MNRISHETWQGLHDRERSWMLKHFCSNNAHVYRREKASKIVPAGDGEFKISEGGGDEYVRPKRVQDCQKALNNYRSALARIWPWDWTAEVNRINIACEVFYLCNYFRP